MLLGTRQKQWLTDLRSGKYEQNSGKYLCQDNKFDALGVLCETQGKDFGIERVPVLENHSTEKLFAYLDLKFSEEFEISLPLTLADELKLYDQCGKIKHNKLSILQFKYNYLATASEKGKTFSEIADFIEKFPACVFYESV